MAIPKAASVEQGAGRPDLLRVLLPLAAVSTVGQAKQIGLHACEQEWTLLPPQLAVIRKFVSAMQEEIARAAGVEAAGLPAAPLGGWPVWSDLRFESTAPSPAAALTGEELFKAVSPSVHRVSVERAKERAFGSAVAIGEHTLLTNCHVVAGASKIAVHSGETAYDASVASADPATDRCVLEVPALKLKPIAAVRKFAELHVGEPVYTVGTPQGFDKTLGSGIISGLRREDGRTWVQTSAPISSGSSGGGLFDAYGPLIGITTLSIVAGEESVAQSLNFAIPVDRFFGE